MARAVWTGSLSFGLVNVPVAMFAATEDRAIRFNQFQRGTSDRVRNKRVNERTGEEVPYQEIAKGYDLGGGEYVLLTPDEIAGAAPGRSHTIEVSAFVDLAEIDPVYFDRPYFLAPPAKGGGKGGERAYALLREALLRANKVALATFVLRDKQYLAAVRPRQDALVLETLLYPDEVRDPVAEIDTLPVTAEIEPRELDMADLLIGSMTTSWQPEQYRDDYRQRLEALIDQKRSGAIVATAPPPPEGAPVIDLLQALEASVRSSRAGAAGGGRDTGSEDRAAAPPDGRRPAGGGRRPPRSSPGGRAPIAAAPPNQTSERTSAAGDDLAALGKAELQRRATDLGIAGRSKMNRDQLEAAVRRASAGEPPAARRRRAS